MVLTFPHLGNLTIPVKAFLDDIRVDYVLPMANTTYSLELGTRLSPEGSCLPLKICIGTLLQACQQGADTVGMVSGLGPCRFGYYCQMQKEILCDAGYRTEAIHIIPLRGDLRKFFHELGRLADGCNGFRFLGSAVQAVRIAYQVDILEQTYLSLHPREIHPGQADTCYKAFQQEARETKGIKAMQQLVDKTLSELSRIDRDESAQPLRVGIVGEFYDVVDPFSSLYLSEKLGRMGVEVTKNLSISAFLDHLPSQIMHLDKRHSFRVAAQPYLKAAIGGHAQETLGHTVLMSREGFDGVIQLYPLGCMPEIVANCIMPTVSYEQDIPVLSLILDEMTAEAGIMTRVEAFLDLLHSRRNVQRKYS